MASAPSSMPSSMLISIICAPFSTCCLATSNASMYWFSRMSRANLAEPVTLVRSPTLIKRDSSLSFKGSSPAMVSSALKSLWLSSGSFSPLRDTGIGRGATSLTTSTMALMCSGVVPQQPPTMFSQPDSANSRIKSAICAALWVYSPNASGNPAFGCALTPLLLNRASSATCGLSCSAPNAQFRPTAIGFACSTEYKNASQVWPDRVRPLASVIVPETMIGKGSSQAELTRCTAAIAAFAFNVSNTVSIKKISMPPAMSPSAASV